MAEEKTTFLDTIKKSTIQDLIVEVRGHAGEMTIEIKAEHIVDVMQVLKSEFGFNYLVDITASDHYEDEKRFEVSYNLVSHAHGQRLRISAFLEEDDPSIATITGLWTSAAWMERECFDMMGIKFEKHEDLRRIYLPEDFQWYPLRKEFPLLGIPGSLSLPEKDPPKGYS